MDSLKQSLTEVIDSYLVKNKWEKVDNPESGNVIYYKAKGRDRLNRSFLTFSKRRHALTFHEFWKRTRDFFTKLGYAEVVKNSVVNEYADDTFFIVAGVQFFADFFHGRTDAPKGSYFIPQPVIRSQFIDTVSDGSVTSFVNLSTGQCNPNIEEHLEHIDNWLTYLSRMGLSMNDFNIVVCRDYGNDLDAFWSGTDGVVAKFKYGDFELGDAGLILLHDGISTVSDVGFGLERLMWAVNKERFVDLVGPKPQCMYTDLDILDCLRSLTLMSMSGVTKGSSEQYAQMKKFSRKLVVRSIDLPVIDLVKHYFSFWSTFIRPIVGVSDTLEVIHKELNRTKNKVLVESICASGHGLDLELSNHELIEKLSQSSQVYNKLLNEKYRRK